MRRLRQDLPEQPQPVHSSEARALQGEVRMPAVPPAPRHAREPGPARADAAREEGEVGVRGVRQDVLRELRPEEAHEDPHGRQAVQLYGLRQSVRQAQQPEPAPPPTYRRAYLRVRRVRQVLRSEGRSHLPQKDPFGRSAAPAGDTYRPYTEGVYQERMRLRTANGALRAFYFFSLI